MPPQQDIREDRRGRRLRLDLLVPDARDPRPRHGAALTIWHGDDHYADALAEPDDERRGDHATDASFLRGIPHGDEQGRVGFDPIDPGWHRGRSPHVQLRVHTDGHAGDAPATQLGHLYFPIAINAQVSQLLSYRDRRVPATSLEDDEIHARQHGEQAIVKLEAKNPGLPHAGYIGRLPTAVDPSATTQVET